MRLGADVPTIAKAKSYSLYMKKLLGVEPEMDIQDSFVRLYYTKNQLVVVHNNLEKMMQSGNDSNVKVNYSSIVVPVLLKKYSIEIIASLVAFYLLSKAL